MEQHQDAVQTLKLQQQEVQRQEEGLDGEMQASKKEVRVL